MFLKSIEIRGFKSFADKTELSFIRGITAVVGPNGSGKSNITDAVRWVLGEQSIKSLRGGKMEDVIFAGTQFRKPVGLAQVSLTLDNSDGCLSIDYTDVKISRRLYRSGESEYYINNTQCRLKDVQELFMDTGIGKEGYSIIGQGKIDAILSGKPEERRNLLEEAAGIVKFKSRKDEAEKKLNNTNQNLIRINDILSTYEERIEPLRLESEKAKLFIKLSSELKEKEVNVIIYSVEKAQSKLAVFKEELKNAESELHKLNIEKTSCKEKEKQWVEKLEQFEEMIGSQKQEYYENKTKYQGIQSDSSVLIERIENLNNLISKDTEQLKLIKEKLDGFIFLKDENEKNIDTNKKNLFELNKSLENKKAEIERISDFINLGNIKVEKLKSNKMELLSNISNNKNDITIINNDMDIIENKIDQLEVANKSYINSIKVNSSTKVMLENEIRKFEEKIHNYEKQIETLFVEIENLNTNIGNDQRVLKELNVEFNKIEAHRNVLINLDKHYEGYNKSVKILMQNVAEGKIPEAKGKSFVLGEVISVKKELETAIEVSLGGAISDIITSDENLAKVLMGYLKTNNIGRATFLPLTIIKGKKINVDEQIKNIPGFFGIASELIDFDFKYINAIEYTLGRVIIAKDMDTALTIAKKSNYSYKIVTLTGEVVNPGGSLTGGSIYQKSISIIGRKREIDELGLKIEDINKEIKNKSEILNKNIEKVKEIDARCLNYKDEIHYEKIEITKIQGKIAAIEADTIKLEHNMKISKEEMDSLNSKFEKNEEELKIKKESIEELVNKESTNELDIEELEQDLKAHNIEYLNEKELVTEIKIKIAQQEEVFANNNSEYARIHKEMKEFQFKTISIQKDIETNEETKIDCNERLKVNEKTGSEILLAIDEIEKIFKESEEEMAGIKDFIKNNSAELEDISLLIQNREEAAHKNELSITKFETELEAQFFKLNDEMELTYAEAVNLKVEIEDINEYKRVLSSIKNSIFELGVVNVGAIEEYKQLIEHYTFMNTQREDLNRAIQELLGVIEEMTAQMRTMFNANFKILRENFNETFRELFKGGSADLILSEGDELTSNIDINVQPPGKKLQNINLMSGGEKVLSAIALLFAILKMKPTPFCILDEIEAALDDANVFRYAEFLKKFSQSTQFIVITHRKGTMEASDIMYGVTMEEKGVSKIVSVNLSN